MWQALLAVARPLLARAAAGAAEGAVAEGAAAEGAAGATPKPKLSNQFMNTMKTAGQQHNEEHGTHVSPGGNRPMGDVSFSAVAPEYRSN